MAGRKEGRKSVWGFYSQSKKRGAGGGWDTGVREVDEKNCDGEEEGGVGNGGVGGMGMRETGEEAGVRRQLA